MHELHHRANRVSDQDLPNNLFAVPSLPAIVFQEWGDPLPKDLSGSLAVEQQREAFGELVRGAVLNVL
jgi:hypothetical protein